MKCLGLGLQCIFFGGDTMQTIAILDRKKVNVKEDLLIVISSNQ